MNKGVIETKNSVVFSVSGDDYSDNTTKTRREILIFGSNSRNRDETYSMLLRWLDNKHVDMGYLEAHGKEKRALYENERLLFGSQRQNGVKFTYQKEPKFGIYPSRRTS